MGAAWKGVRDGDAKFEQVLGTIREVSKLGMEVCVTLGQLSLPEARKLKALEEENRKLKKLLAESMLDVSTLKEMLGKNF